jgi:hypothetical protein
MNEVLKKLREVQPSPPHPEELTSKIMRNIDFSGNKKQIIFRISLNESSWRIFEGFRTAIIAAALFLAGYFIYQQFETKERLDLMENNISATFINSDNYDQTSRKVKFQKLYKAQFASISNNNEVNTKAIVINRTTLNFFLNTIRELEQENTSLHDIIKKQIVDSARFDRSFQ